jgi:hypothetical protein
MRRVPAIAVLVALAATGCSAEAVTDRTSLVDALETAGFTVVQSEGNPANSPFTMIHVPFPHGFAQLSLDSQELSVYEFPDPDTAERAEDAVSPDGWGVAGSRFQWTGAPHFWLSGRVIVLYLGEDWAFVEKMSQILGVQFAGS